MNRDPVLEDTDRYYRQQAEYEKHLPICDGCGERIMSETTCEVKGNYYCEDCFTIWLTEDIE